jgi:PAS domain S-box-containing protein
MATARISGLGTARLTARRWKQTSAADSVASRLALPLLVCAAYFLAAVVGLSLRLPPSTPSVVWPPNAILATALLFAPVRLWWVVLLSALPAHVALESGAFPLPLVFAFFVTNCSEALLAATLIRAFSDTPTRFDSLYRVAVLICGAGLLAPVLSSFLDAAAVTYFRGDPYWEVWRPRTLANILSALAVIPAAAGLINARRVRFRGWSDWRAFAIGGALLAFAAVISIGSGRAIIDMARLPLGAFLPFLLWTAVRYGVTGAGLSLLSTVLVLVGAAVAGIGPLEFLPVDQRVPLLQTFLVVTAIPIMCVAGLIDERRQAEAALHNANVMKSAILASLPSDVAVLDRDGRIIAVNENWKRTTRADVGESYADAEAGANRRDLLEGIQAVLDGRQESFSLEHHVAAADGDWWYVISVVPLRRPEGGAVITHTDVTERRKAEIEAQHSRDELAHLTRVSVVGELTASLSHQLQQPLTAIVGNAQAGRQYLRAATVDMQELTQIFEDIASDARRAADVIHGVRDLLRKAPAERKAVDINELVGRTVGLVRGESLLRGVNVRVVPAAESLRVVGDPVQLEQVLLNLLVNALEATAGGNAPRIVTVRIARDADRLVDVSVEDTGPGVASGSESQVFEPFHTTKPTGMGMGLAIARSIVEAHGGTIRAWNRPEGGAVFMFALPIAPAATPPTT